MDILDKHATTWERHQRVVRTGRDPFAVCFDAVVSPTQARIDGKKVLLLGTNNYLGLTFHPACIEAAAAALRADGTGTTGSRIANGTYALHRALERDIASFLGRRAAIVFSTGYQANLAMISGLAGAQDIVLIDADSHASIYDACLLSGARIIRFRHNDPDDLDRRLSRIGKTGGDGAGGGARLIVVESLYSMLGDRAPLKAFVDVKRRHPGASLLVDEAHAFGVLGANGRGGVEDQGVEHDVDFIVGTFSKALGGVGGFGASDHPRFEVLRLVSRAYMYTAAGAPGGAASVRAALHQIRSDPHLRRRLWRNVERLHQGLRELGFAVCAEPGPIVALRMKDEAAAVAMWGKLLERGVYVNLAVAPGTPGGAALLRCSVSAAHSDDEIAEALDHFAAVVDGTATVSQTGTRTAAHQMATQKVSQPAIQATRSTAR